MISQLRVAVVCTQNLVSPKNLPHKELPPTSQAANDRIRLWIWSGVNLLGQQFIPSRKLSATKRRLAYSAGLSKGGVGEFRPPSPESSVRIFSNRHRLNEYTGAVVPVYSLHKMCLTSPSGLPSCRRGSPSCASQQE